MAGCQHLLWWQQARDTSHELPAIDLTLWRLQFGLCSKYET
jgi:hypothetical protein